MKQLRKSDIKELNTELEAQYGIASYLNPKEKIVRTEGENNLLFKESYPAFFMHDGRWVPTVKTLLKNNMLKTVTIDMGAVKFIAGGADIMRPGIVECDEIEKDEYVSIIDVNNKKPIAVGIAMLPASELMQEKSGKVVRNIHYVGDKIWSSSLS